MSWKALSPYLGLLLLLLGVLTFVVSYACNLTGVNAVQLVALALVIAGIVVHVALLKKGSRY